MNYMFYKMIVFRILILFFIVDFFVVIVVRKFDVKWLMRLLVIYIYVFGYDFKV